jgi:hypothetical protein
MGTLSQIQRRKVAASYGICLGITVMKISSAGRVAMVAFSVVCLLGSGCNPDTSQVNSKEIPVSETPEANKPAIADRSPSTEASPAQQVMTPESVVEKYIQHLNKSDNLEAEKLLSTISAANFRRANVALEPPGSTEATYAYDAPRYATNQQEIAFVDCRISDRYEGEPVESELAWMLRRYGDHWRICGMVIATDEGQPPQLLSFENPEDVAFIQANLLDE